MVQFKGPDRANFKTFNLKLSYNWLFSGLFETYIDSSLNKMPKLAPAAIYLNLSNFWAVCPILEIRNAKLIRIQFPDHWATYTIELRGILMQNEYSMTQIHDKKNFLWYPHMVSHSALLPSALTSFLHDPLKLTSSRSSSSSTLCLAAWPIRGREIGNLTHILPYFLWHIDSRCATGGGVGGRGWTPPPHTVTIKTSISQKFSNSDTSISVFPHKSVKDFT